MKASTVASDGKVIYIYRIANVRMGNHSLYRAIGIENSCNFSLGIEMEIQK